MVFTLGGDIGMKNFVSNYLLKYIFLFCFFLLLGQLIKSLNMDFSKAFAFVCGMILYDVIIYLYKQVKKGKTNS